MKNEARQIKAKSTDLKLATDNLEQVTAAVDVEYHSTVVMAQIEAMRAALDALEAKVMAVEF